MTNAFVMTTINPPNHSVSLFRDTGIFEQMVVVGDMKTPADWDEKGIVYLPPDTHARIAPNLDPALSWNHYSRKMVGYLHCIKKGATFIYETDDDNQPEAWFTAPGPLKGEAVREIGKNQGFVNVYRQFTEEFVWPRGLPLRLITKEMTEPEFSEWSSAEPAIVQGLANGSPDVDAIYRLVGLSEDVIFDRRQPIFLGTGTISPMNSQNTWFAQEVFPLLYLPSTVTFRFTDILRGIVAQAICWKHGHPMFFTEANVRQVRNPHDSFEDFVDEIPMFTGVEKVLQMTVAAAAASDSIEGALLATYKRLATANIVNEREVVLLQAWLTDLADVS